MRLCNGLAARIVLLLRLMFVPLGRNGLLLHCLALLGVWLLDREGCCCNCTCSASNDSTCLDGALLLLVGGVLVVVVADLGVHLSAFPRRREAELDRCMLHFPCALVRAIKPRLPLSAHLFPVPGCWFNIYSY